MRTHRVTGLAALAGVLLLALAGSAAAELVMKVEPWSNNGRGFQECSQRIEAGYAHNLLAREGAKAAANGGLDPESLRVLTDGFAGKQAGDGRAIVDGQPTVLRYYLGKPRLIREVGLFTFNGDGRANQDFEVRFANNEKQPGKEPKFLGEAPISSGLKVLGQNGGGFHASFFDRDGGPLVPFKADWVEFRIWRAYNIKAGQPAKTKAGSGWSAVIELEVLGAEADGLTKEEIERKKRKFVALTPALRMRGKLQRPPRKPAYARQATWQATMLVSREEQMKRDAEALAKLKAGKLTADLTPRLSPWFHIGPFNTSGKRAFGIAYPPEKEIALDKTVDGKRWTSGANYTDGVVHQMSIPNNSAHYFYRTITVGAPKTLAAYLGSDDGCALWLNGQKVLAKDVPRGPGANQDTVQLALKPGQNHLLFKIYNQGGGSGMYFSTRKQPAKGGALLPGDTELWSLIQRDFTEMKAQREMAWERTDGIWARDWAAGNLPELAGRYVQRVAVPRLQAKAKELAAKTKDAASLHAVRLVYYEAKQLAEAMAQVKNINVEALRLSIADLADEYPVKYAKGADYLKRLDALEKTIVDATKANNVEAVATAGKQLLDLRYEALVTANPLIDFDKLLVVKRSLRNLGLPQNWVTNASIGRTGYDNEIAVLSPVSPTGKLTTLYRPEKGAYVGDVDLHWDADRMMFSSIGPKGRWQVFEIKADGTGLRQVNPGLEPDVDNFDSCYLPDGKILFTSTRAFHGVPCVGGGSPVANLCLLDPKTGRERQLCFDQDQNWYPTVLNNGRVLYTRWEYSDSPHYFTRILFHMNPDGTEQMEYAFSNSYWPNSTFYARPVPNHPTKVVAIISGHHGVPRMGQLLVYDPAKGRHEGGGAVQLIPKQSNRPDINTIADALVNGAWPKFLHPYPLNDKFFLVSCQRNSQSPWALCLVDVHDNILPIVEIPGYAVFEPVPLRKTKKPPVIPDKTDQSKDYAIIYLNDIYIGRGLEGVPRGTVKKLRLYEFHYGYNGMGGHINIGIDGPWDARRIHGTIPVFEDGSAIFKVPANAPVAVQPLDAEGKAIQVMRSWYTAMPGEVANCVGCHERQNTTPKATRTIASTHAPCEVEPWRGPARPYSFKREVQPVLDKHCAGCHDGKPRKDGKALPNFADIGKGWRGFTKSYIALHPYVRRPGPESDYHIQKPLEWHADTSELVQMLKKGHHGVTLDAEAWDRLVTWIDLNVPDHGTWAEHRGNIDKISKRRLAMRTKYANRPEDPEKYPAPPLPRPAFVKPKPIADRKSQIANPPGWPFDAAEATKRLAAAGAPGELKVDLGDGAALELALIPAGEFVMGSATGYPDEYPQCRVKIGEPFYMGRFEITNAQYGLFDPSHDSGYISVFNKDHSNRGQAVNRPRQPVVRISWQQAMAFCYWLSQKTGRKFTLPTEAQWEYACRAGTATPMNYGALDANFGPLANLADQRFTQLCIRDSPKWLPAIASVNDGSTVTDSVGKYNKPNAWGLHDMHGNAAEWTRSTYKAYPYAADGRDAGKADGRKVARGGSYYDRPKRATSSVRYDYRTWQCVHNVSFRVACPVEAPNKVAVAK